MTEVQSGPDDVFECRASCGACCIAPSINTPFYGMPQGKPAGVTCLHLTEAMRCQLFDDPRRPAVCAQFAAEPLICGADREQAMNNLQILEFASHPADAPEGGLP